MGWRESLYRHPSYKAALVRWSRLLINQWKSREVPTSMREESREQISQGTYFLKPDQAGFSKNN